MKPIHFLTLLTATTLLVSCAPQLRFKNGQSATPKSLGFTNWTYTVSGTTFDLKELAADATTEYKSVTENASNRGDYLLVISPTLLWSGTYYFPNTTSGVFKSFYKYTWTSKSVTETDTLTLD